MIPDYAYCVATECDKNDATLQIQWGQFLSAKFTGLLKQNHREFFLSVILLLGLGTAIKLCEFIMSQVRVPRTTDIELYKHEFLIHYINSIPEERANFLLLYGLINVSDDVINIRKASTYLFRKKNVEVRHVKPIRFI